MEGYKILDNGAAEGALVSDEELIRVALDLGVDEIVVPDSPLDTNSTIAMSRRFQRLAEQYPQFKYMGVVQANDIPQAHKCIMAYSYTAYINVLGLPRSLSYIHRWQRALLAEAVTDDLDAGASFEAIHCLGMHSWLREPAVLCDIPLVRGMDTSTPISMGLDGLSIVDDEYKQRRYDYFQCDTILPEMDELIARNCRTLLEWSKAPERRL